MKPEEIVSAALRENSPSIAYTYSEPLVHAEYLLDSMELARKHGIANVLVTNGCVTSGAAREILKYTDAANVDLKSFSAETYLKNLGGNLEAVLEFIRLGLKMGVHIEITTLVVPGLNDSEEELSAAMDCISAIDGGVPWHLSAYHPDYRWNAPPTDPHFLLNTAKRARNKLRHVYTGNISEGENSTDCSFCGSILVRRRGYRTDISGLIAGDKTYRCVKCGEDTGIVR
jgi:pyruvate formate lyase activating enzyme